MHCCHVASAEQLRTRNGNTPSIAWNWQTPAGSSTSHDGNGAFLMELGIYTFADVSLVDGPGAVDARTRLRNLMEEIELADQVGLDVFGLGEHHRPDYAASAPVVALAAAAERTKHIRLTSAVTVLSSDDPVRVFQQFATLDLLSDGRAEIMAGRGSFIESFPLFGYNLEDYDELFAEKLDLLLRIRERGAASLPRFQTGASILVQYRIRYLSGSRWAARRNPSQGRPSLACLWRWPLSAVSPPVSRHFSSFTAKLRVARAMIRRNCQPASMFTALLAKRRSPLPMISTVRRQKS
jgi:hypothetical protein